MGFRKKKFIKSMIKSKASDNVRTEESDAAEGENFQSNL